MKKQSLPVLDPARTEFGFCRTHCACQECRRCCQHLPGYLIPADLERMHRPLAAEQDLLAWAKTHLLASPGALVMRRGQTFRIPTLVPARRPDGACLYLSPTGQCAIHAVSPFGCAFFDVHTPKTEADRRSQRGLESVIEAWQAGAPYAELWMALQADGLLAPAPEVGRHKLLRDTEETQSG